MPEEPKDFFISRTGKDAEWAQWIAQVLEEEQYTTFLQDWDFLPGQSFIANMRKGAQCKRTIAVLSPEYFAAEFTVPELEAAFATHRYLPIRVRRCEIDPLLMPYVYIDFVGKTKPECRELLLKGVRGERLKRLVEFPGEHDDPKISVAKLPTVNSLIVGREEEMQKLDDAWTDPATRLVSIVAYGGVGKTSLAINWWHRLSSKKDAPRAQRVLGWSFYSQGVAEDRQASADPFLDHALRVWFGLDNPPQDSWQRGEKLAELIRKERTLLILDGLEPIQSPPGPQHGRLKDPGMVALLKELAAHNPGLCVCTSRLPLTDLEDYGNAGVLPIDLDNLTPESGGEYLKQLGVRGAPEDPRNEELRAASAEFGNHALALTLLGTLLVKRRGGDVRKRDTIPSLFSDPKKGGHARRVYRQYELSFKGKPELEILRILGLFDRPADPGALHILRKLQGDAWAEALENLKDARLVEYTDPEGTLDCHPLLREHFAEEYRASNLEAFREAHSKLFEYYSKQAPHRPDTLEAMTPLFYAVYHGCQAGRHQEACDAIYRDRIERGREGFLNRKLGAYGIDLSLLANFFVGPWSQPAPGLSAAAQRWLINSAAFALRGLGRLAESVEPLRAGTEADVAAEDWINAAASFCNGAELHLTLGDVRAAIEAARRSVEFADQSSESPLSVMMRGSIADALHQSGDIAEAARLFKEAEKMQAELQPEYPILYALQGHLYCDLLLAQGQTAEVLRRAAKTLEWAKTPGLSLLAVALDHLSLGRAHPPGSPEAAQHLDEAVNGLRKAGQLDDLLRGLLARAANYRHLRDFPRAQHDLDEVRILATRCGMRLHLTDYHLEQARLFFAQDQPDAARPHYEIAAKLIAETGYHRRDPELADLAAQLGKCTTA